MIIIGEKEVAANSVSIRQHTKGDKGTQTVNQFIDIIKKEIAEKVIHS
jgi:threonyl-tRNA synthetase